MNPGLHPGPAGLFHNTLQNASQGSRKRLDALPDLLEHLSWELIQLLFAAHGKQFGSQFHLIHFIERPLRVFLGVKALEFAIHFTKWTLVQFAVRFLIFPVYFLAAAPFHRQEGVSDPQPSRLPSDLFNLFGSPADLSLHDRFLLVVSMGFNMVTIRHAWNWS